MGTAESPCKATDLYTDSSFVSASSARARSRGLSGEQEIRRFDRWELGTIFLKQDLQVMVFLLVFLILPYPKSSE